MILLVALALAQPAPGDGTPAPSAPAPPVAAQPTAEQLRGAARLLVDQQRVEGVEDVQVSVQLRDGVPWVRVRNHGDSALTVRWADSLLTPPNGEPGPLLPLASADAAPPDAPPPDLVLAPGDDVRRVVVPLAWVTDGPENDAEQRASWTLTSFSGLELALGRGESAGRAVLATRTQVDLSALQEQAPASGAPLALPAEPAVPPVPAPAPRPPVDHEARQAWDRAYRAYRKQAKTARPIWITGVVVGGLSALSTYSAARNLAAAPRDGVDRDGLTREDHRDTLVLYSALTAGSVGITVPMILWERSANRKLRELGRRP